jgi:hypothetical protein
MQTRRPDGIKKVGLAALFPDYRFLPGENTGKAKKGDIFLYISSRFSPVLYHREHPLSREKQIS